jgi:hypothetical protein
MPRIVMKRSDIPTGLLRYIDLVPNESQRLPPYQPVGQTQYVRAADNDEVVTLGAGPITVPADTYGIAAWLVANVADGPITQSTGTTTVVIGTDSPGDTITIGGVILVAVAGARTTGANDFSLAGGTATTVAADIVAAILDPGNDFETIVTAANLVGVVTFTAVPLGTLGDAVTLATSNAVGFAVSGAFLAGGVSDTALTAADANTIAQDILDNVIAFGDTASAAIAATLGNLNTEVTATAGSAGITAAQLPDILDVLAGRDYLIPAGSQVEDGSGNFDPQPPAGSTTGPGFVDGTLRPVYTTGALRVSVTGGNLAGMLRDDFNYLEATGTNLEAVVVYDDDGTILVP